MSIDNGGSAFPIPGQDMQSTGMTLRDYFAANAMQAMITKSCGQDSTGGKNGVPLVAKYAYEYADAMIEARNNRPSESP